MIILTYDAFDGTPWRDGEVGLYVNTLCEYFREFPNTPPDIILSASTENIIYALRVAVYQGRLSLEQIQLRHIHERNVSILEMDREGRIRSWPDGFCDTNVKYMEQLLSWNDTVAEVEGIRPE